MWRVKAKMLMYYLAVPKFGIKHASVFINLLQRVFIMQYTMHNITLITSKSKIAQSHCMD